MPDLNSVEIASVVTAPPKLLGPVAKPEVDLIYIKFVLDEVIDFLETLKLSGEALKHAGDVLRDVEDLRSDLS